MANAQPPSDSSLKENVVVGEGLNYPVNHADACGDDVESNRALSAHEAASKRLFN